MLQPLLPEDRSEGEEDEEQEQTPSSKEEEKVGVGGIDLLKMMSSIVLAISVEMLLEPESVVCPGTTRMHLSTDL